MDDVKIIEREQDSSKRYYKNGSLHREDGPAIEYANGDKEWFLNGLSHREDGPAKEKDGDKYWYKNGELHREDGPAIECANGNKEWWIKGKKQTQPVDDFKVLVEQVEILKNKYSPNQILEKIKSIREMSEIMKKTDTIKIVEDGNHYWYLNGKLHNESGPAVEDLGDKFWYLNGKLHNENGPAIEYANGDKRWYLNGIDYSEQEFNAIQLEKELKIKNKKLNK